MSTLSNRIEQSKQFCRTYKIALTHGAVAIGASVITYRVTRDLKSSGALEAIAFMYNEVLLSQAEADDFVRAFNETSEFIQDKGLLSEFMEKYGTRVQFT